MYFISATRLRLRSPIYLFPFLWHTYASGKQLIKSNSFIKGKTLVDRNLTFWTLTAWETEAAMRAYRNNDAHKKAMPKLQRWCNEASVANWQQATEELPNWLEVHRRMTIEGRLSKVKLPSLQHHLSTIPAPRYPSKLENILVPKK
jgi:hypothetical protein